MNKTNKHPQTSQQKSKENPFVAGFSPLFPHAIHRLTRSSALLLKKILNLKKHYKLIYASQHKLGFLTGMSRKTVNQSSALLEELGLILPEKRPSRTHIYHIAPSVYYPDNAKKLEAFLRTMLAFPLAVILSKPALADNVTQLSLNKLTKQQQGAMLHDSMRIFTLISRYAKNIPREWGAYGCVSGSLIGHIPKQNTLKEDTSMSMYDDQPKYGFKKQQTPKRTKAWQPDEAADRQRLIERKNRIQAKAKLLGININEYTLGELESLLNGYKVIKHETVAIKLPEVKPETNWNDLILPAINATIPPAYDDDSIWEEV